MEETKQRNLKHSGTDRKKGSTLDEFSKNTIVDYLRCMCKLGSMSHLKKKLVISDYPVISQVFMCYDKEHKGVLNYFNLAEMLDDFNIDPSKIAIKGILNDYGSWKEEYCEGDCIKHQLTIADFIRIVTNFESAEMESIHLTPFIGYPSYNSQEEVLSIISKIFERECEYQIKINQHRCKIKMQMDFLSILNIF